MFKSKSTQKLVFCLPSIMTSWVVSRSEPHVTLNLELKRTYTTCLIMPAWTKKIQHIVLNYEFFAWYFWPIQRATKYFLVLFPFVKILHFLLASKCGNSSLKRGKSWGAGVVKKSRMLNVGSRKNWWQSVSVRFVIDAFRQRNLLCNKTDFWGGFDDRFYHQKLSFRAVPNVLLKAKPSHSINYRWARFHVNFKALASAPIN